LWRLGVFQGGFTLEAAEAVAQGAPVTDITAGIATLVEASLLGRPMEPDETRFWLLETIREYALEQLREAGEDAEVSARHARFYAGLVEQAEPELTGADQASWLERLQVEHANLQAALRWARQAGDNDLALMMAARLWRFWQLRGHFAGGRRWLEDVLAAEGPASGPRAKALIGLAGLCYWQGDWVAAEATYRQARELAKGLDDWWLELEALFGVAFTLACHRGDLQAAAPIEEQFQALIAEHPDPLTIGLGLATSQTMRLFAGDLDGSRAYGEQCLAGTRALGVCWYESQVLRPWRSPPCCRAATSRPRTNSRSASRSPWSWATWPAWPSISIGWDRWRSPSDGPNGRSWWPVPPTGFASRSAVGSRWSPAGGRPSTHEMPPDGSSPTPRSTGLGRKDAP
jgi:hypothetical protein